MAARQIGHLHVAEGYSVIHVVNGLDLGAEYDIWHGLLFSLFRWSSRRHQRGCLLPDQRSEGFPCALRVPVMDVGASGVRSPEVVQRCKAVPSGVIADDAALVIELAVVVIEPEGLALTRLQSSLDLMRDVAWADQPDRVQECAGFGFAVRDAIGRASCRERVCKYV